MISYQDFWYIVAESSALTRHNVLSCQVLDEQLVCYRDSDNQAVVLRDRCLHRCGRLSAGTVNNGNLKCPYHGWVYDKQGKVIEIPSLGGKVSNQLQAIKYHTREQDGYIYVCLSNKPNNSYPFKMSYYKKPGWKNVRLKNLFDNNLSNCVENFIDIPHTAFVHNGIFRASRNELIEANITREHGNVLVQYANEKQNLGSFNWFLNPNRKPIIHTDQFFMPNVTQVNYSLESKWEYVITSQSIPVSQYKTLVYTDISYQFGKLTPFIALLVKRQAKKVIDQDIVVLNQQMEVIKKYGQHFYDTPADAIHTLISEIHQALEEKVNPHLLPKQQMKVKFYI
jgi:phenylpropionate dioxygenase-like ring-hydroxylating dioxygenase large terminal subunit